MLASDTLISGRLISGREACEVLREVGVGAHAARRLLASGLVGTPVRTSAAHLFDADRVQTVAQWPTVPWSTIRSSCPAGIFIARRQVDLTTSRDEQLQVLTDGWGAMSPWTQLVMRLQISEHGSLPFVATVGGFVVVGAEIENLRDGSRLLLRAPGAWFSWFEGHRLPTGTGRPWVLELGPLARGPVHDTGD